MGERKRYAVVGTGGRATVFVAAIVGPHRDDAEVVGLCDVSPTRMAYHNREVIGKAGLPPVPTYRPDDFERMIDERCPQAVIVTTPDYLHDHYIARAMRKGCDVVCEKPLTTDAAKLRSIFDVVRETGRGLRVTFNARYMPEMAAVKQLVLNGAVGKPLAAEMTWLLDTSHGADYFRRWHREKDKSGGLLVHKSTHHFDLVNWWVDSYPQRVFCMADLKFYGRKNAESRGESHPHTRYTGRPAATNAADPFAFTLDNDPFQKSLYLDAESDPAPGGGYLRDRNVFADDITVEDTAVLCVRYRSGVLFNYSLLAYSPWEGLRAAITGTKGRVELYLRQGAHAHNVPPGREADAAAASRVTRLLRVLPMFGLPYDVEVPELQGSHGGSDAILMADLFSPTRRPDPLRQAASHVDGAASALVGISANESMKSGMPVDCDSLFAVGAGS